MKQDIYKNILIITAGLLIFYFIFELDWLIIAAAVVATGCGLISPFAKAVNWFWMKLAFVLGWFNSRVILGIVFFIFLTPLAFLARIFRKDPLMLKKTKSSVYTERNHTYKKSDLENIW